VVAYKVCSPHIALFSDLSWFILFGYFLVHVYMVGYLDVLSEVHISMFVRWMYILVIGRATNIFV
jgi:hypothetical protein